ncbi:MAG: hypothetical protein CMJ25_14705 [Phycisphaerae bacterium]|jgi:hypothetical protein|nr:hypothetical protein [Phycisphaerae bacterium]|tara:strand:+ start:394 stop:684 length:291 start_codon:yes stop_codon:yes gene_type:complete
MDRSDLLTQADHLIKGDRAKDYGNAYENHDKIAKGWNVIAKSAIESHGRITASHVALMMDWVKTARLLNTIDHEDSWIDKAGYTALGGEFSPKDRK